MKDPENWGPHQGQGCEERCNVGKVGELNISHTAQFCRGHWRLWEGLMIVLSRWLVGLSSGQGTM